MFEPLKNLEALQAHELALDLDDVVRSTQAPRHCFFGNPTYPSGEYAVSYTHLQHALNQHQHIIAARFGEFLRADGPGRRDDHTHHRIH